MITVYVWRPTGYEITDERAFMREYKNIREWERSVGHASLQVELEDGRQAYLSFWPDDNKAEILTLIKSVTPMAGKFIESYEKDRYFMHPKSGKTEQDFKKYKEKELQRSKYNNSCAVSFDDEWEFIDSQALSIKIPFLDEEKVYNFIIDKKKNIKKYDILYHNCSTLVTQALIEGTKSNWMENIKAFALRASDVLEATAIIWGAVATKKYNYLLTKVMKKHYSSTKTFFNAVEVFHIRTPKSVWEFATRLNELNN